MEALDEAIDEAGSRAAFETSIADFYVKTRHLRASCAIRCGTREAGGEGQEPHGRGTLQRRRTLALQSIFGFGTAMRGVGRWNETG